MRLHKGFEPMLACDDSRRQIASVCLKGWDQRLIIEALLVPSPRFLDLPGDLQILTKNKCNFIKFLIPLWHAMAAGGRLRVRVPKVETRGWFSTQRSSARDTLPLLFGWHWLWNLEIDLRTVFCIKSDNDGIIGRSSDQPMVLGWRLLNFWTLENQLDLLLYSSNKLVEVWKWPLSAVQFQVVAQIILTRNLCA